MNIIENKKQLLAVCCELRDGLVNNYYLKNSKKIGEYLSVPDYTLIEVISKNSMVGLKEGSNSVVFEVWEVNKKDFDKIDLLKGFYYQNYDRNVNNKINIITPYGYAFTYLDNLNKMTEVSILDDYDYSDYINYQLN